MSNVRPHAVAPRSFRASHRYRPMSWRPIQLTFLWDPSQSGAFPLPLHPQKYTVVFSVAVYFFGVNWPAALCDPSQNGWFLLWPHAHHQYSLPVSTATGYGVSLARIGVDMMGFS